MSTSYPVNGTLWYKDSTNEWVLDLKGTVGDKQFFYSHNQPGTVAPEDVAGFDQLYEYASNATDYALKYGARLPYEPAYWRNPIQVWNGVLWFSLGVAFCWLMT